MTKLQDTCHDVSAILLFLSREQQYHAMPTTKQMAKILRQLSRRLRTAYQRDRLLKCGTCKKALLLFLPILLISNPLKAQTGSYLPSSVGSYLHSATYNHYQARYNYHPSPTQSCQPGRHRGYQGRDAGGFYYRRALHEAYKNAHPRIRPTEFDLARYSKISIPERLVSREIDWPNVLMQDEFSERRMWIEYLFTQQEPLENTTLYEVRNAVEEMQRDLRGKIRLLHPTEYIAARKFLKSVAYEAQFLNQSSKN